MTNVNFSYTKLVAHYTMHHRDNIGTIILLILLFVQIIKCDDIEEKMLNLNKNAHNSRNTRSCVTNMFGPYMLQQNSKNYLLKIILGILILLCILILLGIMKALLGWFGFFKIGMCGLDKLIDLPRPLDYYQETDLIDKPVEYDIAGWPIHPDTKERTVRTVTKRTEFCTNVIFFITYPIIMCISGCSLCFQTYDDECEDDTCFHTINKIVVGGRGSKTQTQTDTYNDEDNEEEEDTRYVLHQMQKSEESLKKQHDQIKEEEEV